MDQFKSAIESGAIQIGMEAGLKGLGGLADLVISSKTRGNDLKEKLLLLKPTIDDLIERSSHLDLSTEESERYRVFQAVLRDGLHHVEESNQIETLDVVGKYFSGTEIQKFEEQIQCFNDIHGPPNLVRDIKKLRADVRELGQQVTLFQQQINPTQLSRTPINGLYGENSFNPPVSDMPEFVAGLDKPMKDVKEILMHESVNIVGVRGMGGSGKTTLALALCNDPEVQDFFHKNIVFLTVGKSPNVKGLLETMWERIIGDTVPTFQSIEDAHNQLKNNLKRIAEDLHVLVVLDDVWPTPKLKRLFFEAKGYKTIATTRHDSTIPETKNARLYSMPLLEEAHALSLFSFWAFDGRHSIPTTAPEDLVKQVTAQCKGLPLALEVIGSSLRHKPWPIWENAKEKLSRAEPISQDHIDDLLSCLATSINILNVKQKQCFLDLGAFPKGRKFSVDSLLDIWVYLRGMEWADAFEGNPGAFEPQAPANGSVPVQNDTHSMFPMHATVNGPYSDNDEEETTGPRSLKNKDQTPRDTAWNSPHLPVLLEEPNSSISEGDAEEDDPLPAIDDFRISGEAIPGNTLQASGLSINGTYLCVFQWVRHLGDGTVHFIEGAAQPEYTITADDVDAWIAIECTPLDERRRQGNLVMLFANESNKITCDPTMQERIESYFSAGQAVFDVQLLAGVLDSWESAKLTLKRSNYEIRTVKQHRVVINEKYTPDISITVPHGSSAQCVITSSDGNVCALSTHGDNTLRDTMVLTMRFFQKQMNVKRLDRKS